MNPFMNMDPSLLMKYMPQAMGQVPPSMPNTQAGAQPGMDPAKTMQLGKLISALGQFQQPPKNAGAMQPMQQAPQMPMGGGRQGGMQMQMPAQASVPPADLYRRLMMSLSPYGG